MTIEDYFHNIVLESDNFQSTISATNLLIIMCYSTIYKLLIFFMCKF